MPPTVDSGAATVLIGNISLLPNLLYARYPNAATTATATTPTPISPPVENGIILKQI